MELCCFLKSWPFSSKHHCWEFCSRVCACHGVNLRTDLWMPAMWAASKLKDTLGSDGPWADGSSWVVVLFFLKKGNWRVFKIIGESHCYLSQEKCIPRSLKRWLWLTEPQIQEHQWRFKRWDTSTLAGLLGLCVSFSLHAFWGLGEGLCVCSAGSSLRGTGGAWGTVTVASSHPVPVCYELRNLERVWIRLPAPTFKRSQLSWFRDLIRMPPVHFPLLVFEARSN